MHRTCCLLVTSFISSWPPAGSIVGELYHKLKTQSSVPQDVRNYHPKRVELIEIINKIIIFVVSSWLFILLYYLPISLLNASW